MAIGARVISAEGRRIQVKDDDGKVTTSFVFSPILFDCHMEIYYLLLCASGAMAHT